MTLSFLLRSRLPALALTCALTACATPAPFGEPSALTPARAAAIVSSPDRTAADRTTDLRRRPAELLVFIGVRPGATALDLSAGGGYTTELLARAIGPGGRVIAQAPPRDPSRAPPAAPEGGGATAAPASGSAPVGAEPAPPPSASSGATPAAAVPAGAAPARPPGAAIADRAERLRSTGGSAAPIDVVVAPFERPVPETLANGGLDLVTLMFNYHDLGHLGVDRARMNRAVYAGLKPGGAYVIADHAGRPGTGISESGTLHRIEEAFLRQEVEAAGFRLAGEASFLRNPNDPRDRNTPEPPQPKDDFVLKFVKP